VLSLQSFHSGFALKEEVGLFEPYIDKSTYTVVGFSYGAIKAFEAVLESTTRIDRLILLSPAFFQTKPETFIKLQLRVYKANPQKYLKQFMKGCFAPYQEVPTQEGEHSYEDLHTLLSYVWDTSKLQQLVDRGIDIEVHLGMLDAIIDVEGAQTFFKAQCCVTTYQKNNHFLLKGETNNE